MTTTVPDYTGVHPDYKKLAEDIVVPANKIFIPAEGAFYTQSIVLYDTTNQRNLVPYVDYIFLQFENAAIAKSAQEVALYIAIKNPAVSNNLRIQEYQFVGGFYQRYAELVLPIVSALVLDIQSLTNGQIIHSPEMFPEEHLLRNNAAVFSCEYMVWAIETITQALLIGNEPEHQAIRDRINALLDLVATVIPQGLATMNAHIANTNDPHDVTAAQLFAYTKAQLDGLFELKLRKTETAVNTNAIIGKSYNSALTELRSNLDVGLITQNYVPYGKMMTGYNAALGLQVLLTGGWGTLQQFLQTTTPIYYTGNSLAGLVATFAGAPVGTTVTMLQLWAASGGAYGNGSFNAHVYERITYRRISTDYNGWAEIYR